MFNINLKTIRLQKRLTQEELSLRSGVSQSYISYLERDNISRDKSPRLETIERIAKGLEICPLKLLSCGCKHCKK